MYILWFILMYTSRYTARYITIHQDTYPIGNYVYTKKDRKPHVFPPPPHQTLVGIMSKGINPQSDFRNKNPARPWAQPGATGVDRQARPFGSGPPLQIEAKMRFVCTNVK